MPNKTNKPRKYYYLTVFSYVESDGKEIPSEVKVGPIMDRATATTLLKKINNHIPNARGVTIITEEVY